MADVRSLLPLQRDEQLRSVPLPGLHLLPSTGSETEPAKTEPVENVAVGTQPLETEPEGTQPSETEPKKLNQWKQ